MKKLIVFGQSLGGWTAIEAARSDPRIQFIVAQDPVLYYKKAEVDRGDYQINQPFIMIHTGYYD